MAMRILVLIFAVLAIASAFPRKSYEDTTCGYKSCTPTKDGVLNVHIVAHTHDDVGWLKTVDQYYYGSRSSTQQAGVQYILDSVVDELLKDPARKFVYVETAFFYKWWVEQTDLMRHQVKKLVNEGRLEFAGGAWSMNDEATVHYQSVVDQFTWGLRILNDTFGECGRPRTGWQIDPFGHSREMANILAMSGYDGLLLGRADYQDKSRRWKAKEAEMVWRSSDDTGAASDLFTGIMYNTYSPPPGFCYDVYCYDDPIIDDIHSPDYNVDKKVAAFAEYVKRQAGSYMSNNVIITMGDDFNYQDARRWFKNLDKLIKYVNAKEPSMNLIYSTPSCYLHSLHESQLKWPTKQDDFFPYASDQHSYWTGYFTSRPNIKLFERKGNNFLQVCKQLYAMTNLNEKDKVDLNMLRTAMGIMQHHDAVTGTEKQHVADDYARLLDEGIKDCLITTNEALNKIRKSDSTNEKRKKKKFVKNLEFELCPLNITECSISEKEEKFIVTVYNPLGQMTSPFVRIPVTASKYTVTDSNNKNVPVQMLKLADSLSTQLGYVRNSTSNAELVFQAELVPPLGYRSYYISAASNNDNEYKTIRENDSTVHEQPDPESYLPISEDIPVVIDSRNHSPAARYIKKKLLRELDESSDLFISNEFLNLTIDSKTGLVNGLISNINGQKSEIKLKQELLYYEGAIGNNEIANNRSSGAYIFRPNGTEPKRFTEEKVNFKVFKGDLVEELHQEFSGWATQIVRIYKSQKHVEFEWLVGPININDGIGKEIVSRFSTSINNNDTFYTDSNGRQMLKRVRDFRPTWDLEVNEPVAGNYYPVTSMIAIKDKDNEMYVLTDRAQGGASMANGDVEIMVHRRLLKDDAFGVGEALNETQYGVGLIARGIHYLVFGPTKSKETPVAVQARQLALEVLMQPTAFFSSADNVSMSEWSEAKNEFSGLTQELPENVHLLTLEPWKHNKVLIRLEHFLQKTDDPNNLSNSSRVNLNNLFSDIKLTTVRETTLSANQYIDEAKKFHWETNEEDEVAKSEDLSYFPQGKQLAWRRFLDSEFPNKKYKRMGAKRNAREADPVVLNAMEIKTFVAEATFSD